MTALENDRLPVGASPSAIDRLNLSAHLDVEVMICGNRAACGNAYLQEDELPDVFGMLFKHVFDGEKLVGNSLGVIEAIHADAQDSGGADPLTPPRNCRHNLRAKGMLIVVV